MVISRAIIRDLYGRERIGAMISLVIAVMMIAQMLSPLTGGLLETAFGWRAIFYVITAASLAIAVGNRARSCRKPAATASRRADFAAMSAASSPAAPSSAIMLCQVLASQIIFAFAGGGPYIVVTQMGRTQRRIWRVVCDHRLRLSDRQCVLRALRAAPFAGEADLVRARAATRRQRC